MSEQNEADDLGFLDDVLASKRTDRGGMEKMRDILIVVLLAIIAYELHDLNNGYIGVDVGTVGISGSVYVDGSVDTDTRVYGSVETY